MKTLIRIALASIVLVACGDADSDDSSTKNDTTSESEKASSSTEKNDSDDAAQSTTEKETTDVATMSSQEACELMFAATCRAMAECGALLDETETEYLCFGDCDAIVELVKGECRDQGAQESSKVTACTDALDVAECSSFCGVADAPAPAPCDAFDDIMPASDGDSDTVECIAECL